MKLYHLHEIAMKVTCTKCKKIMDSPQASTQVPTQGVQNTVMPNICPQCAGSDASPTLPPALGDLSQGAVGPNAAAEKLQAQTQGRVAPPSPTNMANKFRRPPPLVNNAQPI